MIFDEEKTAIRLRFEFGHVALLRPQACEGADAILEAGARLKRPAVGSHRCLQDSTARARIYKFHGCAELAGANEAVYRPRLVARASQIHGWAEKPENKVIAGKLLDLVISKPT